MRHHYTPESIHQLAADHFGVVPAEVKPLAGEVDLNYRITDAESHRYTLKISAPGADRSAIDFEAAIMQHLAAKELPFQTPTPIGEIVELPEGRLLRLQSWVSGRMLDELNPRTKSLRHEWGRTAGRLSAALSDFSHPATPTVYKWNPASSSDYRHLAKFLSEEERELANFFWDRFERDALPKIKDLRYGINYQDAHEQNLLVDDEGHISGVIDFGDAMYAPTVCELAVTCAYAGMHLPDPLGGMAEVVRGYQEVFPLEEEEISVLFDLIIGRLLLTVATAAENLHREPENAYLQVSAAPAWALLRKLRTVPPELARVLFGGSVSPLKFTKPPHSIVALAGKQLMTMDLSVGSLDLGNNANFEDLGRFTTHIRRMLEDNDADFGIGGYGEVRPIYTTDAYAQEGNYGPRWRTTHLGLDVWGPAGTPVYAPFDGVVHSVAIDPNPGTYGPTIILEHEVNGQRFYTLYGHLSEDSLDKFGSRSTTGQVQAGDEIARFGADYENGGWPPHLHFQVMTDMLGYVGDFPGVAFPEEAETWLNICPDPLAFFNLSPYPFRFANSPIDSRGAKGSALLQKRKNQLGYGLSVSYAHPLHIVRGSKQYLYDTSGRRYLDTVNNVAHVGHEHPKVVEAIQRQAAVLNTNSRYLHENILAFAEELTATMPPGLSVVHFVNSGSEANELALRMCENWSGTRNMLAVEVGYHGNTGRTIDVSDYKFNGKGGQGAPPQTTVLPMPDVFRGLHQGSATPGKDYAAYAARAIVEAEGEGKKYGGFICESIMSCGGQIPLPKGYLKEVYASVRAHGGLCISDEVQVGVGRVGAHWWGFEGQGVVPDIVTIGKPLGNGHPLGAVVCTPEVAANFANGMEYFNTFGGNPVSCAAGRAVLDVVRSEGLMEHAHETGSYLKTLLHQLAEQHPLIGDVRGEGLFLGFELVRPTPAPAAAPHSLHRGGYHSAVKEAKYLKERMRELGFLMSTDGPDENVIKIKPPMCFDRKNADQLVGYLDRVFQEDKMRR
ncbi:aminotransferase class III-fold pyridoxal phosphate-dependent enzyme [Neolewinella agarilytica]|uniref:Hydroxylysine kinase /5-phosphonooxy-L-lysine phospho-lyase apoenzyme n=1 Tax=Neolewinella agarilytica TaxID=478744 RepID=A0A1H9MPK7_9BACT|nr:aminotransferase class III-fold pyridoxal phosphate-dependent enzyme [Neolewinella agarilytica]SER25073.1 hydroxylysine kinase /5-phosphonooxy-L-lysine phospho-lyase apoenzyme [Neolewinella agarilytica]